MSNTLITQIHEENKQLLNPLSRYGLRVTSERMYPDPYIFIRELIQNSDDSYIYAKNKNRVVKFSINSTKRIISVSNFGKPFDEKDVRQICTMLPSDKPPGQIGTLGLGFKSVFRISEEPMVHSNNFDFKITNYILPHEIIRPSGIDKAETKFIFNVRPDIDFKRIKQKLLTIDNEILIFLKNISEIKVVEENGLQRLLVKRRFRKIKSKGNEYSLKKLVIKQEGIRTDTTYWLVFTKKYKVPKNIQKLIEEDIRKEMEEIYKDEPILDIENKIKKKILKTVEPSIAIQTDEKGTFKKIQNSRLFVYLPTETTSGLKFLVHAEFKPTADRNSIEDNPLNEWLINKIVDLTCTLIKELKKIKKYKAEFYKIIPTPNDSERVTPERIRNLVFESICTGILDYLRKNKTILTDSGSWARPNTVCVTQNKDLKKLLTKKDLEKTWGLSYFTPIKIFKDAPYLLQALGIKKIDTKKFIDFIVDESNIKSKSPQWFFTAYAFLGKYIRSNSEELEILKNNKIILNTSGILVSPSQDIIYLPSNQIPNIIQDIFIKDLSFIHKKTFSPKKGKKTNIKAVKHFFQIVEVEECKPYILIRDIIIKKLSSKKELEKFNDDIIYECVDFIRKNFLEISKHQEILDLLKNNILFKADNNDYYHTNELYLTKFYTKEENLQIIFKDIEQIHFINDEYIKKRNKINGKKNIINWKKFFIKLGIEDKPRLIIKNFGKNGWDTYIFRDKEWRAKSRAHTAYKPEQIEHYIISDDLTLFFEEFKNINNFDIKKKRMLALLELLLKKWKNYEKQFISKESRKRWYESIYKYKPAYSSYYRSKSVPSGFQDLMTKSQWILSTSGNFQSPSKIFLKTKRLKELMGEEVPYLDIKIKNRELKTFLKFKDRPDLNAINRHIIKLCLKKRVNFRRILNIIRSTFRNPKNYAELLLTIGKNGIYNKYICRIIDLTYKKLNENIEEIEENGNTIEEEWEWWNNFKRDILLLTEKGDFQKPSQVYIQDHPVLRDKLQNLKIPYAFGNPLCKHFFKKLNVKFLSRVVNKEITEIPKDMEKTPRYTRKIMALIPHLKRIEYAKKQSIDTWDYEILGEKFIVYIVDNIKVKYTVDDKYIINNIEEKVAYNKNSGVLYIIKEATSLRRTRLHTYIASEISSLLSTGDDVELLHHYIYSLLNESIDDMGNILDIHGIPRLDEDYSIEEKITTEVEIPREIAPQPTLDDKLPSISTLKKVTEETITQTRPIIPDTTMPQEEDLQEEILISSTNNVNDYYSIEYNNKNEGERIQTEPSREFIENRAIKIVLKLETDEGRNAVDRSSWKEGYDIYSSNGEESKYIEIKSSSRDTSSIGFTPQEWEMAMEYRKSYYVYRVINVFSDRPEIFIIRDPAGQLRPVEKESLVVEGWRNAFQTAKHIILSFSQDTHT